MRRLFKTVRIWWRFRRLRKAWKIIRLTDAIMVKSPKKRQQFWHDFVYFTDWRIFVARQFSESDKI